MMPLHFWRMENLIKVVEALAKEKYEFTISANENGTWDITFDESQGMHSAGF